MVFRPHERLQPFAGAGVAHVDRAEVDALHAGDLRQHVQVRRRHGAVDVRGELDRCGGVPVPPSVQPVPVTVEPQVEAGARAHFDQVYRPGHGGRDHGQPHPQPEGPLDVVGLDQPGTDDLSQFRFEHCAERDERRARLAGRQRPAAGDRGVEPGERVAGPAEQQQVHRAEEQECRVLAGAAAGGQIEKLIMSRDGPAQRAVQRRGGEFGRVLERPAYRLAIGHELSLRLALAQLVRGVRELLGLRHLAHLAGVA